MSEITPQGSVTYTYDAARRRTGMTVAGQPGVAYTYDDAGRLTKIVQGTAVVGFSYDAASRRTGMTLPNGIGAAYTYNDAHQLASIIYAKPDASLLGDLIYSYDANGQRTGVSGTLAKVDLPTTLTSATYGSANRLTNWDGMAITYDANGNITNDGQRTYTWDAKNRLVAISGGATASFQYDAFGRRIAKTINGVQTGFLYDGINPVQELSGATPNANLLTGLGIDEVFTRTDNSGVRNLVADALGNTVALTDATGNVKSQYSYEPFGKTLASGEANTNSFQYTGRENDGTGLYYYRARYYSPELARFISEDPIGLAGGINVYSYVGGNPISFTDPFGLLRYNNPPPRTVPLTGPTLTALQCVEACLKGTTGNADLDLLITGGAEQSGHSRNSHHYKGTACDIAGPKFNPVKNDDVMSCASQCGFGAGHFEDFSGENRDHWHLQMTPGNGVPALPPRMRHQ